MRKPLLLMILDGWGINPRKDYNAVAMANKPNLDKLFAEYPSSSIQTSGLWVGLPDGVMGNSEVGHMNIGAGRIVYQEITRIDLAIKNGSFFNNKTFLSAIEFAKKNNGSLHIMGLLSDGCVHSSIEHCYALLELAKRNNIDKLYLHALMDGRDTSPTSGVGFIEAFENKAKEIGVGKIATVGGRYYGMDRDKRWDRIEKAYRTLVFGEGEKFTSAVEGVKKSYQNNVTDEFIVPFVVVDDNGNPIATVKDGDAFIFFNFRADRARQITKAFVYDDFPYKDEKGVLQGFERGKKLDIYYSSFTEYEETIHIPVAFPPQQLKRILSEVLAENNIPQLRIAETEKYAHVTFFFNGGEEKAYPLEDRILIPSPKVATYDLQPEMSAYLVADKVVEQIKSKKYGVIVLNFANCDMVGHTGSLDAAIKAVEAVDACVGKVIKAMDEIDGITIVTADHGNAEQMIDYETGGPFTQHTLNPVPIILVDKRKIYKLKDGGKLANIAPTILELLEIPKPEEMNEDSLLEKYQESSIKYQASKSKNQKLKFAKMSGAGNDFIVFDNRNGLLKGELSEFFNFICDRRRGIGADGVLLLEKSDKSDFKMRYFNADGGEVEMCGNGGRCIAKYAYSKKVAKKKMTFESLAGTHTAEIVGENVKLGITNPKDRKCQFIITLPNGKPLGVSFINTGVPHVVVFVDNVEKTNVVELGRMIRHHKEFQHYNGTNANFVQIIDKKKIMIRTYERGVEDETLACGTGATASAILAHFDRNIQPPVSVITRGGDILTIHFTVNEGIVSDVFLEGPADIVFEGTITPQFIF